jgi:antitoxin component of MazEF toxin-antitoxin module
MANPLKDKPITQGVVSAFLFQLLWNGVPVMMAWIAAHAAAVNGLALHWIILIGAAVFLILTLAVTLIRREMERHVLVKKKGAARSTAAEKQKLALATSNEIVRAHQRLAKTIRDVFEIEDKFIDAQLLITNTQADELTRQIQASHAKQAEILLDKDPTINAETKKRTLADMANEVVENSAENEQGKKHIEQVAAAVKHRHKEIVDAYHVIIEAQKTLDRYIELNKTDELDTKQIRDKLAEIETLIGRS